MTVLYFKKIAIAEKIGSRGLKAEAKETLVCDLQDLTVVLGLGANFLFGWWWADPVAGLGLIPFLIKEGREGVWKKAVKDLPGRACFRIAWMAETVPKIIQSKREFWFRQGRAKATFIDCFDSCPGAWLFPKPRVGTSTAERSEDSVFHSKASGRQRIQVLRAGRGGCCS
jgi:hypothetical protein